ncbi:MAG TPA: TolC family protein, partial [Epsilonproteobacteria bacterium]|nr:TolC family protein [Campylobacterota bacterium]
MRMIGWLMVSLLGSGNAGNLKALIDASHTENHQIQAQTLKLKAKGYEVEAKERAFWPTLDAGVMHKRVDPNTLVSPGETTTGFVTIGVELYDGGRKRALLRAEALAYESLSYEASAFEKSVTLDIIQRFYLLKKYQAELEALGEKSKELQAQMRRLKRFLSAGLASRDELDRLQAVYDNNLYTIASVELEKESEAKHLALKSGMAVDTASTDTFREPAQVTWEPSEQVKILESSMKVMEENAYAAGAAYRPHLKVENTYSRSDY